MSLHTYVFSASLALILVWEEVIMSKLNNNYSKKFTVLALSSPSLLQWLTVRSLAILTLILLTLITMETALALNANLSYWTRNLSESQSNASGGQVLNFDPQIAVSGTTVHAYWITNPDTTISNTSNYYEIYYRRSTNSGATWEPKKRLATYPYMSGYQVNDRNIAVSGDTVHIIFSNSYSGTAGAELYYLRSINSGVSFEAPRLLYSNTSLSKISDSYVLADSQNVTIAFKQYWNHITDSTVYVLTSANSGANFTSHIVGNNIASCHVTDVQRVGNKIFVLYNECYYYYGMVYGRLYLAVSQNGGQTFSHQLISIPSMNGQHKSYGWQLDRHYAPKMALVGNNAYIVWAGLNGSDVQTLFFIRSTDGGLSFSSPAVLYAASDLNANNESVAGGGNYVYVVFRAGERIYVRRSSDQGQNFAKAVEIQTKNEEYYAPYAPLARIAPQDASGQTLHVITGRTYYSYTRDGGVHFTGPAPLAPLDSIGGIGVAGVTETAIASQVSMAVDSSGKFHAIYATNYKQVNSAPELEVDVFYRGVSVPPAPGSANKALLLNPNPSNFIYDYLAIPNAVGNTPSSAVTVEAWIKPTAINSGLTVILGRGRSALAGGYLLVLNENNHTISYIFTSQGQAELASNLLLPGGLPLNSWTHLAFTYDQNGGADNFRLYVNGHLANKKTWTGGLNQPGRSRLFIGSPPYETQHYKGAVDDVRIWDVARSQTEIKAMMSKQLAGNESHLTAYYPFNDAVTTGAIADATSQRNYGLLMYKERLFATQMLTVTLWGRGGGAVTSQPAGINCGADCVEPYNLGSRLVLTAKPATGFRFIGWSGACAGSLPTCFVTMHADQKVIATFGPAGPVRISD